MSKNKYRIACSYLTNTTGFFVSHLFLLKLISSHSCPCHLITISISPHRTSTKFTGKLFFLCLSLCCLLLETLRGKKRKKKEKTKKYFGTHAPRHPQKCFSSRGSVRVSGWTSSVFLKKLIFHVTFDICRWVKPI